MFLFFIIFMGDGYVKTVYRVDGIGLQGSSVF